MTNYWFRVSVFLLMLCFCQTSIVGNNNAALQWQFSDANKTVRAIEQ